MYLPPPNGGRGIRIARVRYPVEEGFVGNDRAHLHIRDHHVGVEFEPLVLEVNIVVGGTVALTSRIHHVEAPRWTVAVQVALEHFRVVRLRRNTHPEPDGVSNRDNPKNSFFRFLGELWLVPKTVCVGLETYPKEHPAVAPSKLDRHIAGLLHVVPAFGRISQDGRSQEELCRPHHDKSDHYQEATAQ